MPAVICSPESPTSILRGSWLRRFRVAPQALREQRYPVNFPSSEESMWERVRAQARTSIQFGVQWESEERDDFFFRISWSQATQYPRDTVPGLLGSWAVTKNKEPRCSWWQNWDHESISSGEQTKEEAQSTPSLSPSNLCSEMALGSGGRREGYSGERESWAQILDSLFLTSLWKTNWTATFPWQHAGAQTSSIMTSEIQCQLGRRFGCRTSWVILLRSEWPRNQNL